MFRRWSSCLALFALIVVPAVARAGDKEVPPTLRVQVRSLDTVFDNVKLLVTLSGREEIAKQVEALIKGKIGKQGLEGIDPARPFGGYGRFGKDLGEVSGVVLVPIVDEAAFLALLENLNLKAIKNDKGIYTIEVNLPLKFAVSFRFAHKYAYFTALNVDSLDAKNLLPPERIFPAEQKAAISALLRLDQLPDAIKTIVKGQLEQKMQEDLDRKIPGETPAQHVFRKELGRQIVEDVAAVVNDGQELGVEFEIDRVSKQMSISFALTARTDTALAKRLDEMGRRKNLFGSLQTKSAALQSSVNLALPASLQKSFDAIVEEARAKILKDVRDETKRKQARDLLDALAPTFKAGELDAAVSFQGPDKDKHYTIIAAVKVREGDKLNQNFRDLLEELIKQIPESEREKIKFDAETVAGTKIHRFDLGAHYDAKVRDIFGESSAFVAIRNDAIFYAVGPTAHAALKTALASKEESAAGPVTLELSVARLAPLMGKTAEQREKMRSLFPAGDDGTVRLTIEGGSSLRARLTTRLSVVQFLGALANIREAKAIDN